MSRTKIFLFALLLIVIILIFAAVFFLINNTALLNYVPTPAEITQNNQSSSTKDLSVLVPKTLVVPEKFKIGNFKTDRILNVPEEFTVSLFDTGLKNLRFMDVTNDNDIVVTDIVVGKVYLIKDDNKDGIADENIEIDSGLRNAHGIDFYKGDLYVGAENQVVVYRDLTSGGKYSEKEILIPNLPTGGHGTRTVQVGDDEKLYVSVGSSCNLCDESDPMRATVLRYDLDGKNMEVFASGLRNTVGFVFRDSKIWSVDNGRDLLGDDLPPEEVNILEQGKNYGWPNCYGERINNPEYSKDKDYCLNKTIAPIYQMQAHSAPLGISFLPTANNLQKNTFPKQLNNDLFISFHGSWNRTSKTGYKIVRIDTSSKDSQPINFITGWLDSEGNVWGRPVGIKFDHFGDMYISDDENGSIYKVTFATQPE